MNADSTNQRRNRDGRHKEKEKKKGNRTLGTGEEKDTEKQRRIGVDEIFTGSTPRSISIYTYNK